MAFLKNLLLSVVSIMVLLLIIASFFFYLFLKNEYKPRLLESLKFEGNAITGIEKDTFSVLTWNIGYCGLGAESDFFYEGGKDAIPEEKFYKKNVESIVNFFSNLDSVDFILLQEIDRNAKRSYYLDQLELLSKILNYYGHSFAVNYNAFFVPEPFLEPYGKVQSGIAIFSKYKPFISAKYYYGKEEEWPKSWFFPDRCFMIMRFKLPNSCRDLVLVNTHNSYFEDVFKRKEKLDKLKKFILPEYKKGNYVIVGGDWNYVPNDYNSKNNYIKVSLPKVFPDEGWNIVYDKKLPTNRCVNKPYIRGVSKTSTVDFFLISPNIESIYVKCLDLNFQNSDHQPVFIKIKVKQKKSAVEPLHE
ncbi:MAG: endonuclease/exonuclease/phosphatase family protein [Bacteroidales bacterium]|nr:endonuclease/exonuclease/phosphatase family protein [Bacteroidales bacterium]